LTSRKAASDAPLTPRKAENGAKGHPRCMLERSLLALAPAAYLIAACSSNPPSDVPSSSAPLGSDASDAPSTAPDSSPAGQADPPDCGGVLVPINASDSGPSTSCGCLDFSNVGTGDFDFDYPVMTSLTTDATFAHQRASCAAPYWDVRMLATGKVVADLDDGTTQCHLESTVAINDGQEMHMVTLRRVNGTLTLHVDGVGPSAPCAVSFGPLAPYSFEADPCLDGGAVLVEDDPRARDAGPICGFP